MSFIIKKCQTVAGISMVRQFHDFLKSNFWRVFDIWPYCAGTQRHLPHRCNRLSVAPFVLPSAAKPKVIGRDFHASKENLFFLGYEMGTNIPGATAAAGTNVCTATF